MVSEMSGVPPIPAVSRSTVSTVPPFASSFTARLRQSAMKFRFALESESDCQDQKTTNTGTDMCTLCPTRRVLAKPAKAVGGRLAGA